MATESQKQQQRASLEARLREAKNLRNRVTLTTQPNQAPILSEAEIKQLAMQIKKVLKKHLH